MKKLLLLVFVFVAGFLLINSQFQTVKVSASGETSNGNNAENRQPEPNDAALASFIKRITSRSSDGLVEKQLPNGGVSLDLNERFQNAMLSKVDVYGNLDTACVTGLGEAENFFGRNLRTGDPIYSTDYKTDSVERAAAQHEMSGNEYKFYKKLIEDAAMRRAENPQLSTINIVNLDGPGEGFNDATAVTPEGGNNGTTRGAQRLNLFNFAADIWGAFLDSSVPTNIDSNFDPLTPCTTSGGVLGSAGTINIFRDFPNATAPGTWHHSALANKRTGSDQSPGSEMRARFNSDIDNGCLGAGTRFYYGLNNSTPAGRINLLIVLLHEMGHGLGFSSFASGTTGALNGGFPDVYTEKMFDRTINKYWSNMTNAERQVSAVNTGNVLWDGANVKIASGFVVNGRDPMGRVQLFTPNPFQGGSSISHFDSAVSPNLLMEPVITIGLPLDLDLTRQQMRDIGWYRDTNADQVPDAITNIQPSGGSVQIGTQITITWSNDGGFNRPVTIELSTDGGANYTPLAINFVNTGSFGFTVPNSPTNAAKIRVREYDFVEPAGVSAANFTISANPPTTTRKQFDFDGDGKSDISVFRPSNGVWYLNQSQNGFAGVTFGLGSDLIAPADFDGDGKTDVAVFRPSNGTWYYLQSSNNSFAAVQFGQNGDLPRPADFDGDGKADISVFRPSNGAWYRLNSSNGSFFGTIFGQNGDKPLVADFDGDGKSDITVFRPANATFYWVNSTNGGFNAAQFGLSTDIPTPGDFDGDSKTDIAVFRPSNGAWYRTNSSNGGFVGVIFGTNGDIPTAADYDGDSKTDIGVFRPSNGTWYYQNSSNSGFVGLNFGIGTDKPVPSAFQ
jgi:hypothetical protein